RVFSEEHRERDRRRRGEAQLREALLPEAVVEAPLERPHLALRDAICRPRAVGVLRVRGPGEVRQVLEADALVVVAVAGDAAEIVRPAAEEEDLPAELVGLALFRMGGGDIHLHAT